MCFSYELKQPLAHSSPAPTEMSLSGEAGEKGRAGFLFQVIWRRGHRRGHWEREQTEPGRLHTHASWSSAAAPPLGTRRAGRHLRTPSPSPPCTRACTPPARRSAPGAGSRSSTRSRPPSRRRRRTCRESGPGIKLPVARSQAWHPNSWLWGQDEGWA